MWIYGSMRRGKNWTIYVNCIEIKEAENGTKMEPLLFWDQNTLSNIVQYPSFIYIPFWLLGYPTSYADEMSKFYLIQII